MLAGLLVYGVVYRDFVLTIWAIPVAILTGIVLERVLFRFRRTPDRRRPPYESACISSLSTLLLFRSESAWAYAVVVLVAVGSKVLIRYRGRHFLNPTNAGVLFGILCLPGWVTSGQWGYDVIFVFALLAGASLILIRAGTLDSAIAFVFGTLAAQVIRKLVFGFEWPVVAHQFENGALWLFALYMITDPRTTPRRRAHRIAHAILVAFIATALLQFWWVRDSYLWALLLAAPFVPLADALSAKENRCIDTSPQPSASPLLSRSA